LTKADQQYTFNKILDMKKYYMLLLMVLAHHLCRSQSPSFIKSTYHGAHNTPALVPAKIIHTKQNQNNSPVYAAAVTRGELGFLSYCNYNFYIPRWSHALLLYDDNLNLQLGIMPDFYDNFTTRITQPQGIQYFDRVNSSHDCTEMRNGSLLVSGALEIFLHDPTPNGRCYTSMYSSKLFVYRADRSGNIKWASGYDIPAIHSRIIELANGNIIVVANDDRNNLYYLQLDLLGKARRAWVIPDVQLDLLVEQRQTSGNVLVVGSSRRHSVYANGNLDVLCLQFDLRGNLVTSTAIGTPYNDIPGAIEYNPYQNNYLLLMNTEKSAKQYDVVTLNLKDNLNITGYSGPWSADSNNVAVALSINASDPNHAITIAGMSSERQHLDQLYMFLWQFDFKTNPVQSTKLGSANSFWNGSLVSGTFFFSMPNQWGSFPFIPTTMSLFPLQQNDYLLTSICSRNTLPGTSNLFGLPQRALLWTKTDGTGSSNQCETINVPLQTRSFDFAYSHPLIPRQSMTVARYPLSLVTSEVSLTELLECGEVSETLASASNPSQKNTITTEPTIGSVTVYPNPSKEWINLFTQHIPDGHTAEVVITDALGRIMFQQSYRITAQRIPPVSIHSFAPGLYAVKVKDGNRYFAGKFMKQ
jgi:hypothetical protein